MTATAHTDSLTRILARTFRLYVQTHGYHWNVEGPEFRQLHGFFEEQYQDLWNSLDEIAERLYVAVAQVLTYIYQLDRHVAGLSSAPDRPDIDLDEDGAEA